MAGRFQIARIKSGDVKIIPPTDEEVHRLSLNKSQEEYDTLSKKAEFCFQLAQKLHPSLPEEDLIRIATDLMHKTDKQLKSLCDEARKF